MQSTFGQRSNHLHEINKFLLLRNIPLRHSYTASNWGITQPDINWWLIILKLMKHKMTGKRRDPIGQSFCWYAVRPEFWAVSSIKDLFWGAFAEECFQEFVCGIFQVSRPRNIFKSRSRSRSTSVILAPRSRCNATTAPVRFRSKRVDDQCKYHTPLSFVDSFQSELTTNYNLNHFSFPTCRKCQTRIQMIRRWQWASVTLHLRHPRNKKFHPFLIRNIWSNEKSNPLRQLQPILWKNRVRALHPKEASITCLTI